MLQFPPMDPDEERVLGFDFTKELTSGEVLFAIPYENFPSGPNVSVICTAGVDANPSGIFNGPPAYDAQGRVVLQPVANLQGRLGNSYVLEASSGTSQPNKVVVIRAQLDVRIT